MKEDFFELIEFLDKKFREAENERGEIRNDVRELQGTVDTYTKKANI